LFLGAVIVAKIGRGIELQHAGNPDFADELAGWHIRPTSVAILTAFVAERWRTGGHTPPRPITSIYLKLKNFYNMPRRERYFF
jgi:hypothetical protein